MRSKKELLKKLSIYSEAEYIYDPDLGYIAWHFSTGGNIEMLFIEAAEVGKGLGSELYRQMLRQLQSSKEKPYHSMFAFRLESNTVAGKFYDALGFTQIQLGQSIYGGDGTVLMWITFDDLLKHLGMEQK
jgi:ribosomal protein S18 acetylase RimI-like enzyme